MEETRMINENDAGNLIQVRHVDSVLEFVGERVTDSSSDDRTQPRWTDLTLYRLTDGSGRYVLQVVGRSVVYHAVSGCERGVHVSLRELADHYLDEACEEPVPEPCPVCKPVDIEADLSAVTPGDLVVKMEVDRYSAYECRGVDELLQRLRLTQQVKGAGFSMPSLLLLDRAKVADPAIAAALSRIRRL